MYQYQAIVTRIVDGDTVDVDIDLGFNTWLSNQRIRFYNIDAPETRTSDPVEEHFGELAEQFVANLLPVGTKTVLVSEQYRPEQGKYSRILGDFLVYDSKTDSERSLTELMLREGHAVVYRTGEEKVLMEQDSLNNRRKLIDAGVSNLTYEQAGVN